MNDKELDNTLLGRLFAEKPLFLQLRVEAEENVGLTEDDFARKFWVFIEENSTRVEARVDSDDSVETHNWIRFENEFLTVLPLRFVRVVKAFVAVKSHFSFGFDVFRL